MNAALRRVLVPHAIQDRPPALGEVTHEFSGQTMGTTWRVLLCAAPEVGRAVVQAGIQSRLDEVVTQMSTWDSSSDLCRFNRAAPDEWQPLPDAFCEVLACALAVAEASDGAFDPTVGALVDAWGFGPVAAAGAPQDDAVAAAGARCGWRRLDFDFAGGRARQAGGVSLDFSAIAKGYAVDRIAEWLDRLGLTGHLVEVGGELRGSGTRPDGRPWWVELESPDAVAAPDTSPRDRFVDGSPAAAGSPVWVALNGLAVATSGDYRRWFVEGGVRYSHSVDLRTGRPVSHGLASVSVLHASCMAADAWSTALTVMGADAGAACAACLGIAARFLTRGADGWQEHLTPACAALLS